jgi:hypothetical protein
VTLLRILSGPGFTPAVGFSRLGHFSDENWREASGIERRSRPLTLSIKAFCTGFLWLGFASKLRNLNTGEQYATRIRFLSIFLKLIMQKSNLTNTIAIRGPIK